ncbi:hypothetical protein D3C72_1521710 [compost metagenome]
MRLVERGGNELEHAGELREQENLSTFLDEFGATLYPPHIAAHNVVRYDLRFLILRTPDSARGIPASTVRASFHDFVRTPTGKLTCRHARDDRRPTCRGECIGKSSSRQFSVPRDRGYVQSRPPRTKAKDPSRRNTAGHRVNGAPGRGASTPDARADRAWP